MLRHIIICVKQILDTNLEMQIQDNAITQVEEVQPVSLTNPADIAAFELAMRFKKAFDSHLSVISLGGGMAAEALQYCLARGADQAIHLALPSNNIESALTAELLARQIKSMPYDLILCGHINENSRSGLVGPMIAGFQSIPQITSAIELLPIKGKNTIQARKVLEKGDRVLLESHLPALISINPMFIQPAYVAVNRLRKVNKKEIQTTPVSLEESGMVNKVSLKTITLPKPRVKKAKKVDTKLSAADRMKMMMGTSKKKDVPSKIFEGSASESAKRLMDYLLENDLLD